MIEKNELIEFLNCLVDIGIQHYNCLDRPFYHTGYLREANDNFIKLKMETGYRMIPLDEILEIRLSTRGEHNDR